MTGRRRDKTARQTASEGRASVNRESSVQKPDGASMFGVNTYSYMRSHSAEACLARLADRGFDEFEIMVHPGHLWPIDLSAAQRSALCRLIDQRGLTLISLNMPNIDINVAAAAPDMRAYSLKLLIDTVRLAGELGARGVVIGPGKANPLFPAGANELTKHFFDALDLLCPVAESAGTALWVENMPFAFLPGIGELLAALRQYGNDKVRIIYDIPNAYFIGEDFADGLRQCSALLELVHLSDTGRQAYRHDPVGLGTVPFAEVPRALEAAGYGKKKPKPMLEIISRDPDADIIASAAKLAVLGFKQFH
jgi:L-ribulose-5-phosphate 3-epimerase